MRWATGITDLRSYSEKPDMASHRSTIAHRLMKLRTDGHIFLAARSPSTPPWCRRSRRGRARTPQRGSWPASVRCRPERGYSGPAQRALVSVAALSGILAPPESAAPSGLGPGRSERKPRARRGSRTRCRPPKRVSARQLSPVNPPASDIPSAMSAFAPISSASPPGADVTGSRPERPLLTQSGLSS